jgi:signal transduction histidine kinase
MRLDKSDVALAFVVGVPLLSLSTVVASLSVPGVRAVALLVAAGMAHVALALRRSRPMALHGLVCLAFAVQTAVTGLFLVMPSVLVFPMSVYAVTAYGRRAAGLVTGVPGAALVAVRFAGDPGVRAAHLGPNPWLLFALLLAIVTSAWSMGLVRRMQLAHVEMVEERARHREERAARAVLEERTRIAREMHDVIAHSLAVIVSQAKGAQYAPEHAIDALAAIEATSRQALTDMRGLLGVLRTDGHVSHSPQPALADLPTLFDRVGAAGLDVRRADHGTPRPLSPAADLAVFRLVQEALTNTVKHAGTGVHAVVEMRWGADDLTVTVSDDGSERSHPGDGLGLIGMRERLAAVGGSVSAGPGSAGGFVVTARLPYRTEHA